MTPYLPAEFPRLGAFAAVALLGALASVAAHATPTATDAADGQLRATVSYRDLDLASEDGARALYARIRSAARHVCAPLEGPSPREATAAAICRRHAIDAAVASVHEPHLSALHVLRSGRRSGFG